MKRNLFIAILTPCILTCILVILIVLDNRDSAQKTNQPDMGNETVVGTITPTGSAAAIPTSTPESSPESTPAPTIAANPTPSKAPTASPTQAPTASPTKAPTSAPTTVPTPTPALSPDTAQASPTPTPLEETSGDITGTPQEPGHNAGTTEPGKGHPDDQAEPDQNLDIYHAIYTSKGEDYTLVADSITSSYLLINNQDLTIRKTTFKYAPYFEETPGNFYGPVFGYKNKSFIFMAENQLVASDGVRETVLKTFEDSKYDYPFINPIIESENRYIAGIDGDKLVVIDTRTLSIETYKQQYSVDFFIFTDEYLCFSYKDRIPASAYFNTLYTAKDGKIKRHGIIGEIDDHVLDGDTVIIKSQEDLFQINLKENVLTTAKQTYREYMLYLPVYNTGVIRGLSDMRFINYNLDNDPVHSIQLPSSWEAECYYYLLTEPSLMVFYEMHDKGNEKLLPGQSGVFTLIDTTSFPLEDGKYLTRSALKEKLYSGKTAFGDGEIFLLERMESKYNESLNRLEDVLYEIIYAWIPVQGESRAYQFYIYVPYGADSADSLNLMKSFLQTK